MNIPNRISPDAFVRMSIGEIAALPVETPAHDQTADLPFDSDDLKPVKAADARRLEDCEVPA